MQIDLQPVNEGLRNVNFAEPRQNGPQQLVFVLHHDEEPCGVVEKLNAPTQRRLRIRRQLIRIQQYHAFEYLSVFQIHIRFGKKFQILADETNALAVRTIHMHDVVLQRTLVVSVNAANEVPCKRVFATARYSVKYNIGDLLLRNEVLQLLPNVGMDV